MQAELSSNQPLLDIEILGVNWTGLESANSEATANKNIPWLQDVDSDVDGASDAWSAWGAEHLDLMILDAHNEQLGALNLITTSLNEPDNYALLQDFLVDAAMDSQKPWHNPENPLDIDNSGAVVPLDVLLIINHLDSVGAGRLPPPGVPSTPLVYYDTNADGDLTALDVLQLVNFLDGQSTSVEGEDEPRALEASSLLRGGSLSATVHNNAASSDERLSTLMRSRLSDQAEAPVTTSHNGLTNNRETDLAFHQEVVDWLRHIDQYETSDVVPRGEVL